MGPFDYVVKAGQPARQILYKSSGPETVSAQYFKENTMRFMMIMLSRDYQNAKPGWVPDFKEMEAMGK